MLNPNAKQLLPATGREGDYGMARSLALRVGANAGRFALGFAIDAAVEGIDSGPPPVSTC